MKSVEELDDGLSRLIVDCELDRVSTEEAICTAYMMGYEDGKVRLGDSEEVSVANGSDDDDP